MPIAKSEAIDARRADGVEADDDDDSGIENEGNEPIFMTRKQSGQSFDIPIRVTESSEEEEIEERDLPEDAEMRQAENPGNKARLNGEMAYGITEDGKLVVTHSDKDTPSTLIKSFIWRWKRYPARYSRIDASMAATQLIRSYIRSSLVPGYQVHRQAVTAKSSFRRCLIKAIEKEMNQSKA